jgi:hypothetical protein
MFPCPWPDNSLRKLPAEILTLAVNSEVPALLSRLGADLLVPALCRLCPYFFEDECAYPRPAALPAGRTPKLAAWAVGAGENVIGAALAALGRLRARLRETVPALLAVLIAGSNEMTLQDLDRTLENIVSSFPEETRYTWHLEPTGNPGSLVFLCAWVAGQPGQACLPGRPAMQAARCRI